MEKYIGSQKVKASEEKEGGVAYTLADDSQATVTKAQFEAMVSESPYDDGQVVVRKWTPVTAEMLETLLKSNIRLMEVDFVLGQLDRSIKNNYESAVAKLFDKKYPLEISLSEVDGVLKKS